jgi:hypothetical protein
MIRADLAPQWQDIATAQKRIIELEARVMEARGALGDIFDSSPQYPDKPKKELEWCRKRALEAYNATGAK